MPQEMNDEVGFQHSIRISKLFYRDVVAVLTNKLMFYIDILLMLLT